MDLTTYKTKSEIQKTRKNLLEISYLEDFFDAINLVVIIENEHNQIVFSNEKVLQILGIEDENQFLGLRPGEAFSCTTAANSESGCGTAAGCQFCGLFRAVAEARQTNQKIIKECRLSSKQDGKNVSFDFEVSAKQITLADSQYVVVSLNDISDKKRREVMESIFFHDVINRAGSLNGFLDYLNSNFNPDELRETLPLLTDSAKQLIKQILSQRDLMLAEKNQLSIKTEEIEPNRIIESLANQYMNMSEFKGFKIDIEKLDDHITIETDPTLLERILENMLKNAIEESKKQRYVKIGCYLYDSEIVFFVYNESVIPEEIQLKIFQRSFSTKDGSRGLGTYSMKILGEDYLGGRVWFESEEGKGTTFKFALPLR